MTKTKQKNFNHSKVSHTVLCAMLMCLSGYCANAAVVSRGSSSAASRQPVSRVSAASSTSRAASATTVADTSTSDTTTTSDADTSEDTKTYQIENKSSQFSAVLSSNNDNTVDASAAKLADLVRQQRAELDAQSTISAAKSATQTAGSNACDSGLRSCMQEKCGTDFTNCSGDTDTTWGGKLDSCRMDLDCTGEEYRLFAAEIKADRDANAQMASYNAIITCGNQYNNCITTECGTTYSKCLGKSAGDAAIAKCKTIADNCIQQDNGLASRTMQVFGNLRQDAEVQIQKDEQRLYDLRDQMSQQCTMLGAAFDERTFSCVFTVNFYAGDDSTLYASKKLYAGNVFSCTPDWFGIDVTTFMENAYRLTREQSSATSALMGSGLGIAAGAVTSGAISRAVKRQTAENAVKKAETDLKESSGSQSGTDSSKNDNNDKNDNKSDTVTTDNNNKADNGGATNAGNSNSNNSNGEGQKTVKARS